MARASPPAPPPREVARSSTAALGNGGAPAAPPADATQIAALRGRLRTAIAAISEERERHAALTEAQERCRSERREVELALADSRDELNALRREATDPYRYANREVSTLPLAETQAAIDRHRAELDRLDETDRGLSAEIGRCEDRLRTHESRRRQAVTPS